MEVMPQVGLLTRTRLRARLHHGPLSHQIITLAATGQLGMAAAGQIRLAVVKDGSLRSDGLARGRRDAFDAPAGWAVGLQALADGAA